MFKNLPETGTIKVDDEFFDLISEEIPEGWAKSE